MMIKKVKFGLVVKQYNFKITYYKKRKIKPFEFLLLKLADDSPIDNMKLIDFLSNYLQIPLPDKILSDYLYWLIENGYIEPIDKDLEFSDLNISDLNITSSGKRALRENYFPSEKKIIEDSYALNPITKKYIPKDKLLDSINSEIIDEDFYIDFSKDWIFKNLNKYLTLGEQDKIDDIEFISESDMYIEVDDKILLKNNSLITEKYDIELSLEDEIDEKYDIANINDFNINNFLSNFEVNKIINNKSSIKFEIYNENERYNVVENQLKIVFNAPVEEEKYESIKIGSVIFITDDFPIEHCIYFDNNKNNIFAANLKAKYYDSSLIFFKYFSVKNFDFDIYNFLTNIKIKSILSKLLFKSKQEVLNEILKNQNLNIEDKIMYFKKVYDYKNNSQSFEFGNSLENFLKENTEKIDYNIFLIIINKIPNSFLASSLSIKNILINLIPKLDTEKLISVYNEVKNNSILFKIFKDEINKLHEDNPNNEAIATIKSKFDKKKKKKKKKKK